MEFIQISFGDVVTAICLATPKRSVFDKEFNKSHNAKMMPAWSWPSHSAVAPIQDSAGAFLVLRVLQRIFARALSAACV